MRDVGNELLALVFAFLQGAGHVVEGQSQLLHLLGVVIIDLDPGLQIAVTKSGGNLGHFPQGLAFPSCEGGHSQHGDQHHKHGCCQEDVGNPVENQGDGLCGRGDDHKTRGVATAEDGRGDHIPLLLIQSLDNAVGGVSAVFKNLLQVRLVQLQTLMLTSGEGIRAQDDIALPVTDYGIRAGDPGGHVQIKQKFPADELAVHRIGGGQLRNDLGILL